MQGKKILIVDDDADIRLLLDFLLTSSGFEVLEASNGKNALDIIKTGSVDLIITDLTMPEMDGYELIKIVRASPDTSKIPILLVTGREEERVSLNGMADKPDDYIPKPFDNEELQQKVKKLLAQG